MTLFKNILKLEAGRYLEIESEKKVKEVAYWNMFRQRNEQSLHCSEKDACERLLDLFRDATRLRMISDVPFGAFLSGGIDSSLNVAIMSQILEEPVNTFSIGFDDAPEFNELHWARYIARQFGTNHREIVITAEETLSFLPNLAYQQDEPISDPTCVPIYFLSKLAKDHGVSVCQVGEGSDELFCGYPIWMQALLDYARRRTLLGRIQKIPMLLASYASGRLLDRGWGTYDGCLPFFSNDEVFWGGAVSYREHQKRALLSPRFLETPHQRSNELLGIYRKQFYPDCYAPDDLSWMTYLDLRLRLPELLLMKMDKFSMAVALEGRVPFLDHRFVELILSMPQKSKVDGNVVTKYLLKKAIRNVLPDDVIDRPKQGFQLPVSKWYQKYLHESFQEVMNPFLKATDFFDSKLLKRFVARSKGIPWIIVNFALWHRVWIDRKLG
jgi:asparagine synthase (glutamine-hydrolysing)